MTLARQASRHKWVVYAKRPFAGAQQVLAYLSRYTHRVALSPKRLLRLDEAAQTVIFSWKDYADGAKHKTMCLGLKEFVRRFCLHLLPERFVKIRHYGFLSNHQRQRNVAQARALLAQRKEAASPAGQKVPQVPVLPPRLCPLCGSARLRLIQVILPPCHTPLVRLDSS